MTDGLHEVAQDADGWRRLHPLTILKEIGSLAWAIVAAFVLDFEPMDLPGDWAQADAVIAVAVFVYAIARYAFTAYRVTPTSLELRRGVIVKSLQQMPRDRVQAVATNAGFVSRLFGVTTVEVSAADAEDIQLGFVSEEDAEALRLVLERQAFEPEGEGHAVQPGEPVATLPVGRLIVYVATDTVLITGLAAFALGIVAAALTRRFWAPLPAFAAMAWPLVRAFALVGFRSWIEQDRLRIQAGILGRRHTESPLDRIQLVQVRQPLLRRIFGYETISMVTGDIGVSSDSVQLAGAVAPLVPAGSWRGIAETLLGPIALEEDGLERSSPLTVRRTILRGLLVLVPGIVLVGWVGRRLGLGVWPAVALLLVGIPALVVYSRARWEVLGWSVDERHLMLRRGVFDRRLTIVPVHKVQDVMVRATPFQHRLGLATVDVDTAGLSLSGSVLAVDLPLDRARYLADHLAEITARIALPDGV